MVHQIGSAAGHAGSTGMWVRPPELPLVTAALCGPSQAGAGGPTSTGLSRVAVATAALCGLGQTGGCNRPSTRLAEVSVVNVPLSGPDQAGACRLPCSRLAEVVVVTAADRAAGHGKIGLMLPAVLAAAAVVLSEVMEPA